MNLEHSHTWLKLDTVYSITLNPIDKYQYLGQPLRLKKFRNFLYEQLLNHPGNYCYVIEISEPKGFHTQGYTGPRLHLHGTISFHTKKDLANFMLHYYYKITRWSSIDIDTIDDIQVWLDYCHKQHILSNKYKMLTNVDIENLNDKDGDVSG